jgi:hypothetical protein
MLRYYIAFAIFTGGAVIYGLTGDVNASNNDSSAVVAAAVESDPQPAVVVENFTEEISRGGEAGRYYIRPQHGVYRNNPVRTPAPARSVIPTVILPNNVCLINTEISPDRTIEEHIIACIKAQRIRQALTR